MKNLLIMSSIAVLALIGCTKNEQKPAMQKESSPVAGKTSAPDNVIDAVIAGKWRKDQSVRDQYRNPKQTLEFFGIAPGQTVIEISPGGGWYTNIIAPYVNRTGGKYIAAVFDESLGERYVAANKRFFTKFSDKDLYGEINSVQFGPKSGTMCNACADIVLSFRNVHSWMGGGYAEKAFSDFYAALKPGGVLGVVGHRLPETAEQNPKAPTGYVQASYVKDLAKRAGFEFVASSEINANPKDTADHPYGVWTLPPASRTPKEGEKAPEGFDAAKYKQIGESDRFTLKFRKPK